MSATCRRRSDRSIRSRACLRRGGAGRLRSASRKVPPVRLYYVTAFVRSSRTHANRAGIARSRRVVLCGTNIGRRPSRGKSHSRKLRRRVSPHNTGYGVSDDVARGWEFRNNASARESDGIDTGAGRRFIGEQKQKKKKKTPRISKFVDGCIRGTRSRDTTSCRTVKRSHYYYRRLPGSDR